MNLMKYILKKIVFKYYLLRSLMRADEAENAKATQFRHILSSKVKLALSSRCDNSMSFSCKQAHLSHLEQVEDKDNESCCLYEAGLRFNSCCLCKHFTQNNTCFFHVTVLLATKERGSHLVILLSTSISEVLS